MCGRFWTILKEEKKGEFLVRYLSLFSGAGGFEHRSIAPLLACESDAACIRVLTRKMPGVKIHTDARTLSPPRVEFVVGGWPCQDISSAGLEVGLSGNRSGLFYDMVRVALDGGAHTLVGENVPNLLFVNGGRDFAHVVRHLNDSGFPFVSWRTLNAREFGLPQDRRRIFLVASKHREFASAIHARSPTIVETSIVSNPATAGFYWTGGTRSICLARGYVPALKVGASDSKGRSVIALFREDRIWKLSPDGCARVQGFDPADFIDESATDIARMAGNAVPVPMGAFVLDAVFGGEALALKRHRIGMQTAFAVIGEHGYMENGMAWSIDHPDTSHANNIDAIAASDSGPPLSPQAAAGLIVRSVRANKPIPMDLFDALLELSGKSGTIRPSRSNSLDEIKSLDLRGYRQLLETKAYARAA